MQVLTRTGLAGHGAGAGEHEPLGIGYRRGEWIRVSGATGKLKVKNTFASEFLLFGMKSCELWLFASFFVLFPFRSFLNLFRGVFKDIFNWMCRRSVSWSIFLATGTKSLSLLKTLKCDVVKVTLQAKLNYSALYPAAVTTSTMGTD